MKQARPNEARAREHGTHRTLYRLGNEDWGAFAAKLKTSERSRPNGRILGYRGGMRGIRDPE
jgi:hypothetical protein